MALTDTGSAGPFGELPMFALPESTQVIVEFVTPGTSELALTEMSVSGESVKLTPVGVPTPAQVADEVGVTFLELVSIAYPGGAAVSVTVTANGLTPGTYTCTVVIDP